ncbi:hypothetical protein Lpla01_01405 [Lactiplantibacillus plajomi]
MKRLKIKTILLLVALGCVVGLVANVAASFVPQVAVTAEAKTKKKTSQAKKIKKINAHLSKKQRAAKKWIAYRESGYSYTARNGKCYGRYQLLRSYLHGDYRRSTRNAARTPT